MPFKGENHLLLLVVSWSNPQVREESGFIFRRVAYSSSVKGSVNGHRLPHTFVVMQQF